MMPMQPGMQQPMMPMQQPQMQSFIPGGLQLNQQAGMAGQQASSAMMGDIQGASAMQMKTQTEQGQITMMINLNQALAKIFKAIGDAVKSLTP